MKQTNRLLTLFMGLFMTITSYAQVEWACKVADCNDSGKDKGEKGQFGPTNALDKPNVYHIAKKATSKSYIFGYFSNEQKVKIKFEFCNPIIASQIAIVEPFGPGAIYKVFYEDIKGKKVNVYSGAAMAAPVEARIWQIAFPASANPVRYVHLEADPSKVDGWNCLDAIAICAEQKEVDVKINLSNDLELIGQSRPLGSNINSQYEEVIPVISPDGKSLYFDRKNDPRNVRKEGVDIHDDIWYSNMDSKSEWSPAVNIGAPLNNYSHNFFNSISPDGNTAVIANRYTSDGLPNGSGASITHRIAGNKWTMPENINIAGFNNKNGYVSYFLSNNKQILLMAIEDNDSYGQKDVYISFAQDEEGKNWSRPMNIGADVNTKGDEYYPVLASDNVTMYFSSDGHFGYGNSDIYMTKRLDDTWKKWSKPVNLGPKINTGADELGFSIPASGDVVYSYAYNNDVNRSDIYVTEIKQAISIKPDPVFLVTGNVYDAKTKKPLAAKIRYETLEDGKNAGFARSEGEKGSYKIALPAGKHYGFLAEADGYIAVHENLEVPSATSYTEIHKDLYLVPIEVGQSIKMNNVFFERSKPVLLSTSYPELDRVIEMLQLNGTIEIRIDGHTDNQGDAKKNMELSKQRVEVVKNYLVQKGISAKRITLKPFGGTKPIASNDKEETRKLNRRVEFTIVKK